jgi:hypothetical protein
VRSQDGESLNGESELHAQGFYYRRKSAPLIGRNFSSDFSILDKLDGRISQYKMSSRLSYLLIHKTGWSKVE